MVVFMKLEKKSLNLEGFGGIHEIKKSNKFKPPGA